jgi:hypothetical protein
VKICGGYTKEVKDAREDIISLQQEVTGLTAVLEKLSELFRSSDSTNLPTSQTLSNTTNCLSVLTALEEKINPGRRQKVMRGLGLRALKWPLQRNEVERVIKDLERYKS